MSVFCRWFNKELEKLTEHEQERCAENGQYCLDCPDLIDNRNICGNETHSEEKGK